MSDTSNNLIGSHRSTKVTAVCSLPKWLLPASLTRMASYYFLSRRPSLHSPHRDSLNLNAWKDCRRLHLNRQISVDEQWTVRRETSKLPPSILFYPFSCLSEGKLRTGCASGKNAKLATFTPLGITYFPEKRLYLVCLLSYRRNEAQVEAEKVGNNQWR